MEATININEKYNGIEITFAGIPDAGTRDLLKQNGFRWHNVNKFWYAASNSSRISFAKSICANEIKAEPKSINSGIPGVKLWDIYCCSWGYEQTNNDFFQIVGFRGKQSVIVKEVHLEVKERIPSGSMAEDVSYIIPDGPATPVEHAIFINDNETGDVKRYHADQKCFSVGKRNSYQDTAFVYDGGKIYHSWYA